jgi:hypothetical protein
VKDAIAAVVAEEDAAEDAHAAELKQVGTPFSRDTRPMPANRISLTAACAFLFSFDLLFPRFFILHETTRAQYIYIYIHFIFKVFVCCRLPSFCVLAAFCGRCGWT